MCGIVGYTGDKNAASVGVDGLKRLEYRGYDSAGFAVFASDGSVAYQRVAGRVAGLDGVRDQCNGQCGMFHTRWATHGAPTEVNAHPHTDCEESVYVVHNGIIENYQELRSSLQNHGHVFVSETDTEVLAHLIEDELHGIEAYSGAVLRDAVARALGVVQGAYGVVVGWTQTPDVLIAARNSSPLLLGIGDDEMLVSSDAAAVIPHTKRVVYLEDEDVALVRPDGYEITSLQYGPQERPEDTVEWNVEDAQKGGFDHFMLKEIMEQPDAVQDAMRGRIVSDEGRAKLGGLEQVAEELRDVDRMIITACGTASYAAMVGEYMLEEYADIPVEVEVGSEFRYRKPLLDERTALLAISQSGETADTLAAVREAQQKGALTLGIVNVVGSTIARATDAGVYNHAGPEIAVASTKAYTSQLTILALLTVFLGRQRGMSRVMGARILDELQALPAKITAVLEQREKLQTLAERYAHHNHMFYIGRKYNYPTALEGAIKMKEISYIHAEGYAAGEMKHGPIALIDDTFPTVAVVPSDSVYEKMVSNIEETKARGGPVLAVVTEGNAELDPLVDDVIAVPKTLEMLTPIVAAVPLQLLAYYAAVALGRDVDKPRNLAKSVTVE